MSRIRLCVNVVLALSAMSLMSCQPVPNESSPAAPSEPILFVFDEGSSAPGAPPGGLSFALWNDGLFIITVDFPMGSGRQAWGQLEAAALRDLTMLLDEAIAECVDLSLATPDAQHLIIGRRSIGTFHRLDVPTFAIRENAGATHRAVACFSAIRTLIEEIHEQTQASPSEMPNKLKQREQYWFDDTRRALRE